MKITILTAGTRGDVTPFIAVALALLRLGHEVRILGHKPQGSIVETYGIRFSPCGSYDMPVLRSEAGQAILTRKVGTSLSNKLQNIREYGRIVEDYYGDYLASALQLTADSDLILTSTLQSFFGAVVSDYHQCKVAYLGYIPGPPTKYFPHFIVPPRSLGPLTAVYNRLSHRLLIEGVWQVGYGLVKRVLAKTVGDRVFLPRWYPESDYRKGNRFLGGPTRGELSLYGYSERVIPRPPDWPNNHLVTGYWFLEPATAWHPHSELIAFLEAGPPPVYIGFGSMLYNDNDPLVDTIKRTISTSKDRFIIGRGWSDITHEIASSTNALVVDEVPFQWLFPKLKGAIHHGGAGTVAAALRAGIPSCVVPFITDQSFWGRRLWAIGAGLRPIHREDLTVEALRRVIYELNDNRTLQHRVRELSAAINREDGIGNAIKALQKANLLPADPLA